MAVLVAIIRPGMMDSGNTERYLRRAMAIEQALPPHPLLEHTFADTYGLMCFQEDVVQAARDFAGFSMGEADVLRKGVGKKNPEFIAKQKPMFYEGGQQPRVRVTAATQRCTPRLRVGDSPCRPGRRRVVAAHSRILTRSTSSSRSDS